MRPISVRRPAMLYLAVAATSLGFGMPLSAAPLPVEVVPTVDLSWGPPENPDQWNPEPIELVLDGTDFYYTGQQTWVRGPDGDRITITAISGNVDPIITLVFSVQDFGAPSTFGIFVDAPLVPSIVGPASWQLTLSGSFADGGIDGGSVAMSPGNTFGLLDASLDGSAFAGIGAGMAFASPGGVYGPFNSSGLVDCGAGCDSFGLELRFVGSGGGDAFSFTGRLELNQVPVPAAAWLFAPALGLLGLMRRRATG